MKRYTIEQLQKMRESEDHVEFKEGKGGNVPYNGKDKNKPADRRRCILGYVTALCNEGGGRMVIGMHDSYPHQVIGTKQNENKLGELESNIYRDTNIRTIIYELYEDKENRNGRVIVIEVPSRPIGKVYKFEDVPLMRVGENLLPMDEKTYLSIIQEQEPDFSEQICNTATFDDLDPEAIRIMKEKYAKKQNNPSFISLDNKQVLTDLQLMVKNHITNAAILLVGKEKFINKIFPQAKVILEYRNTESQINFDDRIYFGQPFFILIKKLWNAINMRNGSVPIREEAYIFEIPFFNEDVIREAINNAFAHRNYRINSEIIIKQYPTKLSIVNAGGFPMGVTINNLLTTPSVPRNRLLTDILAKTGIVERSGQGMDKIFLNTLSEGKPEPDYTESDDFNVTLNLSANVKDKAFAIFMRNIQQSLADDKKLTVFDVMALCEVRDGKKIPNNKQIAQKLEKLGLLEKYGKTNAIYYILARNYYELANNITEYSSKKDWNTNQVWSVIQPFLMKYGKVKRSDLDMIVEAHVSKKQMRRHLDKLKKQGLIVTEGQRKYMTYMLGNSMESTEK